MQSAAIKALQDFHWTPQPLAQQLVWQLVDDFLGRCSAAAELSSRMKLETGTRFIDWIEFITLPPSDPRVHALESAGYSQSRAVGAVQIFDQPQGVFPSIVVRDGSFEIAIKVESVEAFCAANHLVAGKKPLAASRIERVATENDAQLSVIERHGARIFDPPRNIEDRFVAHRRAFRSRDRNLKSDREGISYLDALIDAAIADLGRDTSCDLFFSVEREFWQSRNRAAQIQNTRQNRLGLGWANHDHHTYRCARENFSATVALWEKLGFVCRERFYAGREAGWGAQVMEQPICKLITFNDVDLSPDELVNDFAHEPLPPRDKLGTIGLWCGLHGDSILQAGMHHLEAQFDFDALRDQLQNENAVKMMKPFTNFSYLRQAFTEGERWPVDERRLAALLERHLICPQQATEFRARGAIGSHLENLERNDGFKGFNQRGVSEIIAATDPRRAIVGKAS